MCVYVCVYMCVFICVCVFVFMHMCVCIFAFYMYRCLYVHVLFNNILNTFYLWLYRVRHMVKDHSDSKRGNPLLPHGLLFPINSKGSIICTIP